MAIRALCWTNSKILMKENSIKKVDLLVNSSPFLENIHNSLHWTGVHKSNPILHYCINFKGLQVSVFSPVKWWIHLGKKLRKFTMYSVCDSLSHSRGATDATDSAYKGINQSRLRYNFLIMTPSFFYLSSLPKPEIAWNSFHLLYC